ncbi:hypothetical protein TIFTF001_015018 [Ficus carica]|uniref:Uncharacterized protein n=1 Tax=Ficus carica TaxID=3494 RepID=A0AA88A4W8_FICCA|nr:hypothetical protein TIFTF001_015018 [Ficus carica]
MVLAGQPTPGARILGVHWADATCPSLRRRRSPGTDHMYHCQMVPGRVGKPHWSEHKLQCQVSSVRCQLVQGGGACPCGPVCSRGARVYSRLECQLLGRGWSPAGSGGRFPSWLALWDTTRMFLVGRAPVRTWAWSDAVNSPNPNDCLDVLGLHAIHPRFAVMDLGRLSEVRI